MNINKRILNIIQEIDNKDTIIDNEINLDSIQNVQLLYELEKEFKIDIPYEYLDPDKIRHIDSIIKMVEDRIDDCKNNTKLHD